MSSEPLDQFRHEHVFLGAQHDRNARRTWAVIALTTAMMGIEIVGGTVFGSMALLADGFHMSTHAGAMLIAAFASAIVLAVIALLIGYESAIRLIKPTAIAFDEALVVAVLGLLVNIASAWLLKDDHQHHGHDHEHDHDGHDDHDHDEHGHDAGHHDLNLRAAYVHVLADAAVSVLAIVGLLAGRQLGWVWMDPLMGIVGFVVIAKWSIGLLKAAGAVLLDMRPGNGLAHKIEHRLEARGDHLVDLHVWRLGPGHHAAVVSLLTTDPLSPAAYRTMLEDIPGLSHVTIEVQPWPGG